MIGTLSCAINQAGRRHRRVFVLEMLAELDHVLAQITSPDVPNNASPQLTPTQARSHQLHPYTAYTRSNTRPYVLTLPAQPHSYPPTHTHTPHTPNTQHHHTYPPLSHRARRGDRDGIHALERVGVCAGAGFTGWAIAVVPSRKKNRGWRQSGSCGGGWFAGFPTAGAFIFADLRNLRAEASCARSELSADYADLRG